MFSCGVFIDLQEAFDTVDHDILFPQRSVLGPLLFLIYVNDTYNASNDDVNIFFNIYFKIFISCKHCTQQTTYNFSNRERNSFHTD